MGLIVCSVSRETIKPGLLEEGVFVSGQGSEPPQVDINFGLTRAFLDFSIDELLSPTQGGIWRLAEELSVLYREST